MEKLLFGGDLGKNLILSIVFISICLYILFSSCIESFDEIQSDNFLGNKGTRTIFRIECETGKVINSHSYYHDITEILLLPGTQFQVIDQNYPSNDLCIIRLKKR